MKKLVVLFSVPVVVGRMTKSNNPKMCIEAYQAKAKGAGQTNDKLMANFIDKLELPNFFTSCEGYEHFLNQSHWANEGPYYVTFRFETRMNIDFVSHIDSKLVMSKQYRYPTCFLLDKEDIRALKTLNVTRTGIFGRRKTSKRECEESWVSKDSENEDEVNKMIQVSPKMEKIFKMTRRRLMWFW